MRKFISLAINLAINLAVSLAVSLAIILAVSLKKVITELVAGRRASMHMVASGRRIWIEC